MERLSVVEVRGGVFEAEHPVAAVLVDARGEVLHRSGAPVETTLRSSGKPFQLLASLSAQPDAFVASLSERDLALGAASHSAQPGHIEALVDLLARLKVPAEALECGAHAPMHAASGEALLAAGRRPQVLHNNCSGKHAFMVAAARAQGWPDDYRSPGHPLQQRISAVLERVFGGPPAAPVVDGCGAPCWVGELAVFGRGWASLAAAMADPDARLGHIGWALHRNPWWMSGDGRIDHHVVSSASEEVVSKEGAAGLLCVALPRRQQALVLKVSSGVDRVRFAAVHALAARWLPGLLPEDPGADRAGIRNVVGLPVGELVAVWG